MTGKQWGAIRKLPSGRYQASYVVDGIRYSAPSTFSDDAKAPGGLKPKTGRDKAEAWLRGIRSDVERGAWVSPDVEAAAAVEEAKKAKAERFGTYAATWLEQRVSSKGEPLRPKTRAEYQRQLERGLACFADDRIAAITPARVRAWHAERREASGATSAGAEARLLRAILNTAAVDGIISTNPVPAPLTRTKTGLTHRPPTMEELTVILDRIGAFYRLAVLLAAYGGLRSGEWRALRRRDLEVVDGRVFVRVERSAQYLPGKGWIVGPPKSAEGVRTVPMPTGLTGDVERHLVDYVGAFPDALIFPPTNGDGFVHDRQFNAAWNPARDAAGLRVATRWDDKGRPTGWDSVVREHDLRAFAGTLHAQSGATLRETMSFLGHSTTVAAMAYQATTGREADLADRMPLPSSAAQPKIQNLRG